MPTRRQWLKQTFGLAIASGLFPRSSAFAQTATTTATTQPKPDPYADAVFVDGPPPLPANGSFTIAVMPDTQYYTRKNTATFMKQTEWIVANRDARRIAAVLHLGDITYNNGPAEWQVAQAAMKQLDGHVPYFMVPGNHDYGTDGNSPDRTSGFSAHFPVEQFRQHKTFGGTYDKEPDRSDNTFHLFEAGGRSFVVICLEWCPRNDVVRWANDIATKYADREAILVTHGYLYHDNTRYDWQKYARKQSATPHYYKMGVIGETMDGQELWDNLVSRHKNFILTLNGHVTGDGLGHLVSPTPTGRDVNQMLVNFQKKPNGGDGWLRLLEFKPDRSVEVFDYSPTRDQQNVSEQNRFAMKMAGVTK